MARRNTPQPLRAGGHLWGQRRERLGVSLRQLEALTNIPRASLSLMERGRLFPTSDEMDNVMRALDSVEGAA